uniref:Reverse transcriptase domain-containing protein n=1 Tax=Tanacetum cinerariifolium TaxID=118510 RepID=A0A699HJH1_TANCI|nr:reverse transcriptase domain-containing protein [Tanacetum cinerariifolium]
MANTTPLVTTVTKPATNPRDVDATPRLTSRISVKNIMRTSYQLLWTKFAMTNEKGSMLGHRRQSAFDRLSETYSPSTTKSRPRGTDFKDHPRGRSRPHKLDTSNEDCPEDRERFCGVEESYDDSYSHFYHDENHSRHMKRRRDNESPLYSVLKSDSSDERYRKSRSKRHKSTDADNLTRPWMYEEEDPFTPRIRNFESSRRTRMSNNVKTYDGTGDLEDHVKIFQRQHRWNDSYKDLKTAFLAYFMQQKKYVKDPVEIYNIKQKDGETIEDFMERFKVETGRMKGAPECMRISGFMHGVNNPELTKRLNEHVPKTMEEMMITTTAFIRGEAAAASKKKGHTSWNTQDHPKRQTSEKRTPKEILTAEAGKFQPSPPMVTPVEKRSSNKFCDFHNDKVHSTDECMQLKKQIEELVRAGKLSHLIKDIKHGRDQSKTRKKEKPAKDKPTTIYMIQSWQRMTRKKVTQSFERVKEITFPPLTASSGVERPLVIEAEMGGHMIHRDADHSTRAWMNFMIVRSLSPYNGIIGRPGIREIQAVPSTAHEMLKFLVEGRIVTIRSTILIPAECTSVITSSTISKKEGTHPENFKVVLHPDFPDQEVAIGGTLSVKGRTELCSILKKNLDIFAWKPSDMTGVPRSVTEHRLNIREGYLTVRQKKRGQAPEHAKAIQSEVQKLVEAWIIREIQLAEPDEEKTSFHTGQGVYCYTKMPFGLKNAGATYQRLVDKAFDSQISRNIEVYVDDLVVKSYTEAEMLRDIDETFRTLRKINMKLNPKKCTFGAEEGVFLGYVVTPEGIKPCLDKIAAVLQLPSPWTIKEVQSLNGKLAKAEQAFKQLKQHLSELPLLVAPKPKEELIRYLSATYGAISAVLMTERGATQTPIYFISRALQGLKLNYTPMEKLVLSLVFAAKRLRRTTIEMECHARRTQYHVPAKNVSERTDPNGFSYQNAGRKSASRASGRNSTRAVDTLHGWLITYGWVWCWAYTDKPGGNRVYLPHMGVQNIHVSVDSKLVANQVLGTYVSKEENMIKYLDKVKSLVSRFTNFSISQARSQNKKADALSKIASTSFAHLSKQVLVEILKEKSIKEKEVTTVVEEDGPTWMTPIMEYLKERTIPSDRKEARKLRIKAQEYELLEGILYRRSFLTSWLRCVEPLQAEYVIREIHEGSCSMHAGPRSVVAKAIWLGYYWPTMHRDTRDTIRKCNDCRIHRSVTRNPQQPLTPITAPWPFYKEIVSDNNKQFSDNPFKYWCDKLNITQRFALVKHPQSNELVERANRSLREGIKARLGEGNKNWVEELPHVLWAYRTMIKSSHGDTPFSLTYGTEAVIPVEIGMPTYRTAVLDVVYNDEELRLNLDLLEGRRERAAIREAKAKLKMIKYYNARVRDVTFRPCDFVYRSNDASHAMAGGKLGPMWEGPYEVTEALGDGAYKLRSTDGTVLPRT